MRFAAPITIFILAAALLGGCGGSSSASESTATSPGASARSQPASGGGAAEAPAGASVSECEGGAEGAEALRAGAVSCGEARAVLRAWQSSPECEATAGASHEACTVRSYRCIATASERGLNVSCARGGEAISFIAEK